VTSIGQQNPPRPLKLSVLHEKNRREYQFLILYPPKKKPDFLVYATAPVCNQPLVEEDERKSEERLNIPFTVIQATFRRLIIKLASKIHASKSKQKYKQTCQRARAVIRRTLIFIRIVTAPTFKILNSLRVRTLLSSHPILLEY
jgi:hypothetical protein